jgi:O-antigen/teichoic acid export membrane protein
MSSMVGLSELGQYAVAASFGTATFPLSASFAMVLFPRVAGDASGQATEKIRKALRYNLVISSVMALTLAILCPWLLPLLFGKAYQAAIIPALILLAAAVFLGCNYVLSDGVRGLGAPMVASFAEMLAAGITIVGLLILLPVLGIVGAALVSLVAYATVFLLLVIKLRRMSASQAANACS